MPLSLEEIGGKKRSLCNCSENIGFVSLSDIGAAHIMSEPHSTYLDILASQFQRSPQILMTDEFDQSGLNNKYFLDRYKYNCPFCNRNSVTYKVERLGSFDWSQERDVYLYKVTCGGCEKTSLHLSNYAFSIDNDTFSEIKIEGNWEYVRIYLENGGELDDLFFFHQPTTFFTLDLRINKVIRELIAEAEGCAKMGYLVGASGCLRKAIYEFTDLEGKKLSADQLSEFKNKDYGEKIKYLKSKYPLVPADYFDALANIQDQTSQNLHEGTWEEWSQPEFKYLLEITKEILNELYVKPEEKASVLQKIIKLNPKKKQEVK